MSTSDFFEYDADQISIIFNLIPIEGGWADGPFCTVKRDGPMFKDKAGTDGTVVRSKTNDRRGQIEISLLQASQTNLVLSAMAALDENSPNGAGVGPTIVKDNAGSTMFFAAKSWIAEMPESQFDRECGTRTWVIRCARLNMVVGGN